jgi:HD-GYP domain-containing protein (c-di-GMP phosphodiesterase class II)
MPLWWVKKINDIFMPDLDLESRIQELTNTSGIPENHRQHIEFEFRSNDGDIHWFSLTLAGYGEEHKQDALRLFLVDITTLRNTRTELLESKRLLDQTSRIGKIGGFEMDITSGIGRWTEESYRIHGKAPGSPVLLDELMDTYTPKSRKIADKTLAKAIRTEQPWDAELEIQSGDGNRKWMRTSGVVHKNKNGHTILQGVIQDITERKSIESKLEKSLITIIDAMAFTVEKRDPYTSGHMNGVAELSMRIARKMQLDESRIKSIGLGARIHDIGKIAIPAEILTRPGKLLEPEFNLIKTHPEAGYDLVKNIDFHWPIAEMILQHHEKLDGSGYPHGLTGNQICLEAQIIAVADIFEAMTSHRPYRPARTREEAIEVITAERGTRLNADAVEACIALTAET